MANEKDESKQKDESEKTVADVFNTLTEEQKTVVYALIGQALEEAQGNDEDEGDEKPVKHNVFDQEETNGSDVLCHADQVEILNTAKKVGSLKAALELYAADNELAHADDEEDALAPVSGFVEESLNVLFPEYKDARPVSPSWSLTIRAGSTWS